MMIFRNYLQLCWKWSDILCLHNNAVEEDAKSWHAQQMVLWVDIVRIGCLFFGGFFFQYADHFTKKRREKLFS